MLAGNIISVIIPALDEENAIGLVVTELKELTDQSTSSLLIDNIIVSDNGSTDKTSQRALAAGATVISEPVPGYGRACLSALKHLPETDIVLFIDGDHSCYVEQSMRLLSPIVLGADLVIGSRTIGKQENGALTTPQKIGNIIASFLIRQLWGVPFTDLGPYRAIRLDALQRLNMQDQRFGWTVEMQVKAAQKGLVIVERGVDTRKRIGVSKISGTLSGCVGAAYGILGKIARLWWLEKKSSKISTCNIQHSEKI